MTTTRAIDTLAEHGYQVQRTPNHFEVTGGGKTEIISEQQLVDMAREVDGGNARSTPIVNVFDWLKSYNEELGI